MKFAGLTNALFAILTNWPPARAECSVHLLVAFISFGSYNII